MTNNDELGEKIAWGSETALMDEAADLIDQLTTELKQLRAERARLLAWIDEYIELADEIMTQDEKDLLIEIKSKLPDSAQSE